MIEIFSNPGQPTVIIISAFVIIGLMCVLITLWSVIFAYPASKKDVRSAYEKLKTSYDELPDANNSEINFLKTRAESLSVQLQDINKLDEDGKIRLSSKLLRALNTENEDIKDKVEKYNSQFRKASKKIAVERLKYQQTIIEYAQNYLLLELLILLDFFYCLAVFEFVEGLPNIHISFDFYSSLLQIIIALIIALYLGARKINEEDYASSMEVLNAKKRAKGIAYGAFGSITCLIVIATRLDLIYYLFAVSYCCLVLILEGVNSSTTEWKVKKS